MDAGAGSGRYGDFSADDSLSGDDFDLDGRIATGVQNLTGVDASIDD